MERYPLHVCATAASAHYLRSAIECWNRVPFLGRLRKLSVYSQLEAKSRIQAREWVECGRGKSSPFGPVIDGDKLVQPDAPEQDLG